jgi:rhamnogalacturonyl hydrolase YesR
MKKWIALAMIGSLTLSWGDVEKPSPEAVKAITKKVADWQIETFEESGKYRALSGKSLEKVQKTGKRPRKYPDLTWHMGALYAGMDQWRKVADEPAKYTDFLKRVGDRNSWKLYKRPYHADDHTVGQFYLSLYEEFNDPAMLKPTQERFDFILANPKTGSLKWGKKTDCHHRWGWCDALFMAPPVWARLAKVTGNTKYLDFMDQEYHATYDLLWDKEDRLFWRDSSYFPKREENGSKLYWARGNGWVFGGLALMIPDLPKDWKGRDFYVDLFKKMAVSLKECQRADGTWSMGLLGGVEGHPIKETSGTSFFTFGLAWGVNNGILDRATYEPILFKAWNALTECVTEEGLLGYVQPVGASPGDSFADKTEVYGVGAFLAAGTEMYKLVGKNVETTKFTTFMKDGGWCWYQDPRAIIHNGKLFMGSVKGSGDGEALIGVYDLEANKPLGNVTVHAKFDKDDHNSPVFHARSEGSVLAVYARHGRDRFHYSRICDPNDPLTWSEEFKHERVAPNPKDKVTYMNLHELKKEGRLYNFYRSIDFNPTFVTSTDHGTTWSEPVHFFKNEVSGRHRPYARYAGNGKDTVYVSITDAHPRDYGNSIYYFEFRDGKFFKADGSLIKDLGSGGPLLPSESELVYKGTGNPGRGGSLSAIGAAWTSSVKIDEKEHPHIGYTLYNSNTDHRYRLASWDGSKWIDREVAFGGKCLYDRESSYTGLITMDPVDPTIVFISTDVDPSTGKDSGGQHEIYRAKIGSDDDISSIQWEAVTKNSPLRNIRPMVLRGGKKRVVLWQRGRFTTFKDYDLDTVGFIE